MKRNQIIWTIVGVIVLIGVVGYFAGWFSKKSKNGNGTATATV